MIWTFSSCLTTSDLKYWSILNNQLIGDIIDETNFDSLIWFGGELSFSIT